MISRTKVLCNLLSNFLVIKGRQSNDHCVIENGAPTRGAYCPNKLKITMIYEVMQVVCEARSERLVRHG